MGFHDLSHLAPFYFLFFIVSSIMLVSIAMGFMKMFLFTYLMYVYVWQVLLCTESSHVCALVVFSERNK